MIVHILRVQYGTGVITDNVSGFTISQMFSSLTSDITTPEQYRQRLINLHLGSTGNTAQQVNDLFNSY